MEAREFLGTVLGGEGQYCVFALKQGCNPKTKFYDSLDKVVSTSQSLDTEGWDAYFALGTYKDPVNGRTADNVQELKSFFLDLDCGPTKKYATQPDAIKALIEFNATYKLPPPTIVVNSGRGLHVYWALDRAYSKAEWLAVAARLKAACIEANLYADHGVTADSARILRVPSTHNYKGDTPLPVKILGRIREEKILLDKFAAHLPEVTLSFSDAPELSIEDKEDLQNTGGLNSNYQKSFKKLIELTRDGKGCGQIARAIRSPNDLSYDEWLHVLSIPKHCDVGGEEGIHLISKRYEGYSEKETNNVAESIDYPHLCTSFETSYPEACKDCIHKKDPFFKSPIKLCMEVKEAESNVVEVVVPTITEEFEDDRIAPKPPKTQQHTIPPYPGNYFRGANGGVYLKTKDKDGNDDVAEIYDRDLYVTKRLRDPIDGPCYMFEHHTAREGVQEFVLKMEQCTGREEFRKAMGRNDIFILPNQASSLMNYIQKWVKQLHETVDFIDVRTQFGWTENMKSYVIGDKEIFANRIVANVPSARTSQYISLFTKKGSLDGWKRIAKFYDRPKFEEHQMMFGLSFGSPLMKFVPGIPGAIFHLMSAETGYGKTTGMKGGASVWGNPNSKLILKGKDTGNSGWHRAEVWKNHVLYIDEVSNYLDKDASDFCYAISDGEQKNRMSNKGENVERYRGEPWDLMCGTSGNSSLAEKMTGFKSLPQGEMARLIESPVEKRLFTTQEANEANDLQDDLANHYGHAGTIYIQHVLQTIEATEDLVIATRDQMLKDAKLESQHRYWVAGTAVTFAGLTIAKDIGLIDWDLEALYRWIIGKLISMRLEMKGMIISIEEIVAEFYQDHPQGWLRVTNPDEEVMIHTNQPSYSWVGRAEPTENKLYIFPTKLKEWCVKKGHHYAAVRQLILTQMNGRAYKMRAGRGTQFDVGTPYVLECSWSHQDDTSEDEVDNDTSNVH